MLLRTLSFNFGQSLIRGLKSFGKKRVGVRHVMVNRKKKFASLVVSSGIEFLCGEDITLHGELELGSMMIMMYFNSILT